MGCLIVFCSQGANPSSVRGSRQRGPERAGRLVPFARLLPWPRRPRAVGPGTSESAPRPGKEGAPRESAAAPAPQEDPPGLLAVQPVCTPAALSAGESVPRRDCSAEDTHQQFPSLRNQWWAQRAWDPAHFATGGSEGCRVPLQASCLSPYLLLSSAASAAPGPNLAVSSPGHCAHAAFQHLQPCQARAHSHVLKYPDLAGFHPQPPPPPVRMPASCTCSLVSHGSTAQPTEAQEPGCGGIPSTASCTTCALPAPAGLQVTCQQPDPRKLRYPDVAGLHHSLTTKPRPVQFLPTGKAPRGCSRSRIHPPFSAGVQSSLCQERQTPGGPGYCGGPLRKVGGGFHK